ncbi:MAG: glycoside hydrolase [Chlorobi bacterium]|nr:glycoside hydrolase [Chlorobiota bacterium]
MKKIPLMVVLLAGLWFAGCRTGNHSGYIRVNQPGYLPYTPKTAVWLSKKSKRLPSFTLADASTGKAIAEIKPLVIKRNIWGYTTVARLDFTSFHRKGTWQIRGGNTRSPVFRIGPDIFNGAADFLLQYIRQQQCGYNPFFGDSCHTEDGFVIFSPDASLDSTHVDVTGGWHDASDYLRYVTTSATAVLQLLYAWECFPDVFRDRYDPSGNPGADSIPDVINSARWGMDWLVKMNPSPELMFHQVADDRDHIGFKIPAEDNADYGRGRERPVYVATDKPQGSDRYQNHTTGIASVAGKFAAAFAAGARILKNWYPDYATMLADKAVAAYIYGRAHPGVCQTAPHLAPYYYAEQNWKDDMEAAAAQLYLLTGEKQYLSDAVGYGDSEPVSPWMGADTARHYQWYPFVNSGHLVLASLKENTTDHFKDYLKQGLERLQKKAGTRPFENGVPYIWCSDNLTASALIQAYVYRKITGDSTFRKTEAGMCGWLLGNNPWGTSMVVGFPSDSDSPVDVHSVVTVRLHRQPLGGLVDGPVYSTIFNNLKGLYLDKPDEYRDVQPDHIVYHDDFADYATNEPTLDGTASLVFYFAALEHEGKL